MFFWEPIISLAECISITTQKLPFGFNITIELKNIINKTDNTGTLLNRNKPRWMPLLSDVFVTLLSSIVVVVCLFSWRYNPLWLYFHSPVAGFSLLVFEVS
jgi:hypothetical protein